MAKPLIGFGGPGRDRIDGLFHAIVDALAESTTYSWFRDCQAPVDGSGAPPPEGQACTYNRGNRTSSDSDGKRRETCPFGVVEASRPSVTTSFSTRRAVRSGRPVMCDISPRSSASAAQSTFLFSRCAPGDHFQLDIRADLGVLWIELENPNESRCGQWREPTHISESHGDTRRSFGFGAKDVRPG
jgi:hypothetical protein